MAEEKKVVESSSPAEEQTTALTAVNTSGLNEEALTIINQIIAEQDIEKTKDLTYLFNQNQNKKTIVRVNKLNELLDVITDQAIKRFSERPDEISNQELITSMKTVNEMIERNQKQVVGTAEQPLIQINHQTNEVNVGGDRGNLSRDSREKVKNAVMSILSGLAAADTIPSSEPKEVIDATEVKTGEEE